MGKGFEYMPAILVFLLAFFVIELFDIGKDNRQWVYVWLPSNTEPNPFDYNEYGADSTYYHEIDTLQNGALIGQLGACWYLIDSTLIKISSGYHEIHLTDSGYYAKLGAGEYLLSREGKVIQEERLVLK